MIINNHTVNDSLTERNDTTTKSTAVFASLVKDPNKYIGAKVVVNETREVQVEHQKTNTEKFEMFSEYYKLVKQYNAELDEEKRIELSKEIEDKKIELKHHGIPTEIA